MSSTKAERRALQDAQRSQKAASQMNNPARVIFVRHGETNWNAEGRIQGQFDEGEVPVLSELGVTQAHEVAEYLAETFTDVSCIYTSDLKRAAQTAEVVQQHMPALPVRTSAELRERSVGTLLQGLTHAEAAVEQPDAYTVLRTGSPDADVPGGGESEDNFYGRARTFLTALADAEAGSTVVVVTHGGFLGMVHRACTGRPYRRLFQNCAFGEVRLQGDAAALIQWDIAVSAASRGSVAGGGRFG